MAEYGLAASEVPQRTPEVPEAAAQLENHIERLEHAAELLIGRLGQVSRPEPDQTPKPEGLTTAPPMTSFAAQLYRDSARIQAVADRLALADALLEV
jgi:hypothetical protein